MLDRYLEVLDKTAAAKRQEDELTALLMNLPLEEVSKIASTGKLAYCGDPDDNWLKKYEGSSLYDQAVALEEELLALEAEDIKARMERPLPDSTWEKKDMVRLKKRMLDLDLTKQRTLGAKEAPEEEEEEEEEEGSPGTTEAEPASPPPEMEAKEGSAFDLAGRAFAHAMNKVAEELSPEEATLVNRATLAGGAGGVLLPGVGAGLGSKVSGGDFLVPAAGSFAGGTVGELAGRALGGNPGGYVGRLLGSVGGGALGARTTAKNNVLLSRKRDQSKEASVHPALVRALQAG